MPDRAMQDVELWELTQKVGHDDQGLPWRTFSDGQQKALVRMAQACGCALILSFDDDGELIPYVIPENFKI